MIFNAIVLVIVTRIIIKHKKKKKGDGNNEMIKTLVSIVSIMVMYGLSWVFGVFSIAQATVVVQWLFLIFNTTQGFCLFLFFCVIGEDGRNEWRTLLGCKKKEDNKKSNVSTIHNRPYTSRTKQTTVMYNRGATSSARISESVVSDSSMHEDTQTVPSKTVPLELPTIQEDDKNLLICNEEVPVDTTVEKPQEEEEEPKEEPVKEDCQLPPHVLIKLQEVARNAQSNTPPPKPKRKRRRKQANSLARSSESVKSEAGDSQVPPHVLLRMKASKYSNSQELSDHYFYPPDDHSLMGSQISYASQTTDTVMCTLSEEDEVYFN